MKLKTIKYLGLVLAFAAGLTTAAKADLTFGYSVDGTAGIPVGGDTVTLGATSLSTITLPDLVPTTEILNGVTWNYTTTDGTGTYTANATRDMTITLTAGSQTLSQTVEVQITKFHGIDDQQLDILPGAPIDFAFAGGDLIVTPDELIIPSTGVVTAPGTASGTLTGQFLLVQAVPEPTTIISGALLLLPFGASTLRIVRKNRAV